MKMKRREGLSWIFRATFAPFFFGGPRGQNRLVPSIVTLEMMRWDGQGVWFPHMHNVSLPQNENPYMHLGHIECMQPNPLKDPPGHGKIGFSIPWSGAKDGHLFNWCDRALVRMSDLSSLGFVSVSGTERPDVFRYYYPYDSRLDFVSNAVKTVREL